MNSFLPELSGVVDLLIRRLPLTRRISLGYLFTAITVGGICLIVLSTFWSLAADFRQLSQVNERVTDNLAVVNRMQEMQRQARIYIHEGHGSARKRVHELHDGLQPLLQPQRYAGNPQVQARVARIRNGLDEFIQTFEEMRELRDQRERLVSVTLRSHANLAQRQLEILLQEPRGKLEYSRMLNALLQVEKDAYRYFDSLDARYVDDAVGHFHQLRRQVEQAMLDEPYSIEELHAVLRLYEDDFLAAVQRTRGYLFLVNVVLAAQTYEVGYQARQLDALVRADSAAVHERVNAQISALLWGVLLSTAALLLVLGLVSWAVGCSITRPLQRLTRTFQALNAGEMQTLVPDYPLDDELGQLGRAADSFRLRSLELAQSKRQLERSNEEMEQFVYTVSHDLKSPIVTSMGFIGIIKKLAAQGKYEQALEKLDKVVKSNERMSQLITDLLELSRVGRMQMERQVLDLDELLASFVRLHGERLAEQGCSLSIVSALPTVHASRSRVLQVFENLLSNAQKYAVNPQGTRVEIGAHRDDGSWLVFVRDNGPGIAPEYHEKIFGLFYRLDVGGEGTGIGLAVARKIMKYYGGDIWVESQPGAGTTFWMRFPDDEAVRDEQARQ